MGQYFMWINPVKKQFFTGHDFSDGTKRREIAYVGSPTLDVLYTLMDNEWKGDPIAWIGDDYTRLFNESNQTLKVIESICGAFPYDFAITHFVNVAIDFEKSNSEWMVDTYNQNQYEYLNLSKEDADRFFSIDEMFSGREMTFYNPDWDRKAEIVKLLKEKGFFARKSEHYRYIINHSKKEFIDRKSIKPDEHNTRYDPFPALMIKEDDSEEPRVNKVDNYCGLWLGDDIIVSNDSADVHPNYEDASNKYIWENGF